MILRSGYCRQDTVYVVCFAVLMSVCTATYGVFYFLPLFQGAWGLGPFSAVWFAAYVALALNTALSFAACVGTDGGRVPARYAFDAVLASIASGRHDALQVTQGAACDTCLQYKPERTHHCSYCRRCTLRYDHHCPWIGRCVGYYNAKYFLQFIVSAWLLFLLMSTTLFRPAALAVIHLLDDDHRSIPGCRASLLTTTVPRVRFSKDGMLHILAIPGVFGICAVWVVPLFFIALALESWLGYLAWRYVRLARRNMTRVEVEIFGEHHAPYDLGTAAANLAVVFGPDAAWWEFLVPTPPRLRLAGALARRFDSDSDG